LDLGARVHYLHRPRYFTVPALMIAAGMVVRPVIHPIPLPKVVPSRRRRYDAFFFENTRYDGLTRAQDGYSRTRSLRNKTKARLCPAATTTSNAGPATNHRARASGSRQTRRSPQHIIRRATPLEHEQDGKQPTKQDGSQPTKQACQQVKRRWSASHSHNVHIDPAEHGSCCFAAPSSSTPDAKFQRSRSACLPVLIAPCSPFPQDHRIPQPGNQKGQVPKKKHKHFYSAHSARQFYTKTRRVQPETERR